MLRLLVLFLIVANGLLYLWSSGYLDAWGLKSTNSQSEKHRLEEQIEPERIVILPPSSATAPLPVKTNPAPTTSSTAAPAATASSALPAAAATQAQAAATLTSPAPTMCLTAGVFNDKQISLLKQTLATKLPTLGWRFEVTNVPAKWIVYMGKYANTKERDLKKSQLDQIKVRYELLNTGNLEPGLSLGSFATQAAANQSLQQLVKQGVRTARVLQESPEQKGQSLVVSNLDAAARSQLDALYATMATTLANKPLQPCKK
jgi:hypothetical protein